MVSLFAPIFLFAVLALGIGVREASGASVHRTRPDVRCPRRAAAPRRPTTCCG